MTAFTVTQVVDGSAFSVVVTLDPARIPTTLTADELTFTLTPEQAKALDTDLFEALEPPPWCQRCEAFGVVVVEGLDYCGDHARALDDSREASAS